MAGRGAQRRAGHLACWASKRGPANAGGHYPQCARKDSGEATGETGWRRSYSLFGQACIQPRRMAHQRSARGPVGLANRGRKTPAPRGAGQDRELSGPCSRRFNRFDRQAAWTPSIRSLVGLRPRPCAGHSAAPQFGQGQNRSRQLSLEPVPLNAVECKSSSLAAQQARSSGIDPADGSLSSRSQGDGPPLPGWFCRSVHADASLCGIPRRGCHATAGTPRGLPGSGLDLTDGTARWRSPGDPTRTPAQETSD